MFLWMSLMKMHRNIADPWRGQIKVTYENGDSETIRTNERNRYRDWISRYIVYDGDEDFPEQGLYDVYFELNGITTVLKNGAQLKDKTEMPTINEAGSVTVLNNGDPIYVRLKTGKGGKYKISTDPFIANGIRVNSETDESDYTFLDVNGSTCILKPNSVYYISERLYSSWFQVDKMTFTVTAVACSHEETEVKNASAATCTKEGYTGDQYCKVCKELVKKGSVISKTAHKWNDGKVTKAATCTENGIKTFTCQAGEESRNEVIPMTGHGDAEIRNAKTATCVTEGYTGDTYCKVCQSKIKTGTAIARTAHSWGSWEKVSDATVLKPEVQKQSCQICGTSREKTVGGKLKSTMKVSASSLKLKVKQTTKLLTVSGMKKGDSVSSVKSNNSRVVKVTGFTKAGVLTLKAQNKTGKAKVTITLAGGAKKTVTVTVQKGTVKTTKISGLAKAITLKKGKKQTLKPVLTPITSQEKITYTTSNKKVATVTKNGVITAKKKGTAKITVKSGKKKAVVTVKVK